MISLISSYKMTKLTIVVPRGVSPENVSYRAHPPIGAVSVLGEAREKGYQVSLIDTIGEAYLRKAHDNSYTEYEVEEIGGVPYRKTGLSLEDTLQRVAQEDPDAIGISLLTIVDRTETKKLVERLKEQFPSKPLILGGKEATIHYRQILGETKYPIEESPGVDYIVLNEGQSSIVPLLRCIESGHGINGVEGIAYKRDGRVITNPTNGLFNPNKYTLPASDLYPSINVSGREKPFDIYSFIGNTHIGNTRELLGTNVPISLGVIFTSYGCPFQCTFCDNDGRFSRYTPENVKQMIDTLVKLYDIKVIDFTDNNFAGNNRESRDMAFQILDYLKSIGTFRFSFSNGLTFESMQRNNYELLHRINKSGIWAHMGFPVETASDRLLKSINKPHRLKMVRETLEYVRNNFTGLNREGYFIGGIPVTTRNGSVHPAETPEELKNTVKFIEYCFKNDLLDQANLFTLAPITDVYYPEWRESHPEEPFETLLFSQVSNLWPYNNGLLVEAKREVEELHKKYRKTICRRC